MKGFAHVHCYYEALGPKVYHGCRLRAPNSVISDLGVCKKTGSLT